MCGERSMRASASDTALDRLDASSISAQRYLSPNDPRGAVCMPGPSGRYASAFPATPPRKKTVGRAASQPAATHPDERIRAAAARPAMSARLPEVCSPCEHASIILLTRVCTALPHCAVLFASKDYCSTHLCPLQRSFGTLISL